MFQFYNATMKLCYGIFSITPLCIISVSCNNFFQIEGRMVLDKQSIAGG